MPKRGMIAGFLTMIGLALLLSFKTPTETQSAASTSTAPASASASASTVATPSASSGSTATATTTPTTSATATASATASPSTSAGVSGTFTGASVSNPYGSVQVQVVISNGTITDVIALSYPTGRESTQINAYAIPILREEALSAQSAQINNVSGATWTSNGYAQSLQSALDQAGI